MSSSRKLLSALALALALLLLAVDSAPLSRNLRSVNDGRVLPDLTTLLASHVGMAERVRRPLSSSASGASAPFISPIIGAVSPNHDATMHSGVKITLQEDGTEWLVHKGNRYGDWGQTVVTDARNMGPGWTVEQTRDFHGSQTVSDLISAGGRVYDVLRDNCHHAAERIMKLP